MPHLRMPTKTLSTVLDRWIRLIKQYRSVGLVRRMERSYSVCTDSHLDRKKLEQQRPKWLFHVKLYIQIGVEVRERISCVRKKVRTKALRRRGRSVGVTAACRPC